MAESSRSLAKAAVDKVLTRYQQAAMSVAEDMDIEDVDVDVITGALHGYADSALDLIARETANAIIREGRAEGLKEAAEGLDEDALTWRRSAVLDDKTCGPCDDADGSEIDGPDDDLSDICEGGESCRCIPFAELPE